MGRPNKGVAHLQGLPGTRESKLRAAAIWRTMNDELSVNEACEQIGVGPTQFANLRAEALLGFLGALQPKPVGRPRLVPLEVQEKLDALQRRVAELEHENHMLKVQAEVAPVSRVRPTVRSKSLGATTSRASPKRSAAAGGPMS